MVNEGSKLPVNPSPIELFLHDSVELQCGNKMKILKANQLWKNSKQVVMKVLYADIFEEVGKIQREARISYKLSAIPRIIDVYDDIVLESNRGGYKLVIVSEYAS